MEIPFDSEALVWTLGNNKDSISRELAVGFESNGRY